MILPHLGAAGLAARAMSNQAPIETWIERYSCHGQAHKGHRRNPDANANAFRLGIAASVLLACCRRQCTVWVQY
jgi:hypothetical protein